MIRVSLQNADVYRLIDLMPRFAFILLLATAAISPALLGSNRPLFWGVNAAIIAIALGFFALSRKGRRPAVPASHLIGLGTAFAAVFVWLIIQALPFAPQMLANPLWQALPDAIGDGRSAISVDLIGTYDTLLRYLTYLAAGFLALQLCRDPDRGKVFLWVIFASALIYAAYGLLIQLSGSSRILWFDRFAYQNVLVGTFIGRNAFAAYLGIGMLVALVLLINAIDRVREARSRGSHHGRIALAREVTHSGGMAVFGLLIFLIALLLTGSRAGIVSSLAASLLVLMLWMLRSTRQGAAPRLVIATAAIVVIGAIGLSGSVFLDRLETTSDSLAFRMHLYVSASEAIAEAPVLGWGAGAYPLVFPQFRSPDFPTARTYAEAHNSYLEAAATYGIPATILLISAFAMIFWRCLQALWVRRRDHATPLAAIGVMVLFALHSLVDFSLQFQANALIFSMMLGAGLAHSWRRDAFETKGTGLAEPASPGQYPHASTSGARSRKRHHQLAD